MIRLGSNVKAKRSGTVFSFNTSYTVLWAWTPGSGAAAAIDVWVINADTGTGNPNHVDALYSYDAGGGVWRLSLSRKVSDVYIGDFQTDGAEGFPTFAFTAGTTYYLAVSGDASSIALMAGTSPENMVVVAGGNASVGARPDATLFQWKLWNEATGVATQTIDVCNCKAWQGGLSASQVRAAMACLYPNVFAAEQYWSWPMILEQDKRDYGPNGYDWSNGEGTPTYAPQPSALPNQLYLPTGITVPFTLAQYSSWEDSEDLIRRRGSINVKTGTALASTTGDEAVTTNPCDVVIAQYWFGPFTKAGTWKGAWTGVIRALEGAAAANAQAQMIVRIMAADGTTIRGSPMVLEQGGTSNEFSSTTLTSRYFPLGAGTGGRVIDNEPTFEIGDWLVIELGARDVEGASTNRILTLNFGDTGSDLDLSEADTGTDAPWLQPSYPLGLAFDPMQKPIMHMVAVKRAANF